MPIHSPLGSSQMYVQRSQWHDDEKAMATVQCNDMCSMMTGLVYAMLNYVKDNIDIIDSDEVAGHEENSKQIKLRDYMDSNVVL